MTAAARAGAPDDRGICLLEEAYFHPMVSAAPLAHLKRLVAAEDAPAGAGRRLGAFYAVGVTGNVQFKVVTVRGIADGWDGWRRMLDARPRPQVDGGSHHAVGRVLGPVPGAPDLWAGSAPFFLYEVARVRPGAALDYAAAVREERAPLLAEHGHQLSGMFEVLTCDAEVVTFWGTDIDGHLSVQRAYDAALGLDAEAQADPRLIAWRKRARQFLDGPWRETLIVPFPGSDLAPGR